MCIYIMDYQMGYEWNMSGKKNHGILFWNVSLSSFKHSWKIPPIHFDDFKKIWMVFRGFSGPGCSASFFLALGKMMTKY